MSIFELEGDTIKLRVHVHPKSSRPGWGKITDYLNHQWIQLKVSAPPVEGAANEAVVKFIAKELRVAKSSVRLIKGEKSRYKIVSIQGDKQTIQALAKKIRLKID